MRYLYQCECGYNLVYETDIKPPATVKCKDCKKTIKLKK
jgi:hypothetical protein